MSNSPYRTPEVPAQPPTKYEWYFKQSDDSLGWTFGVVAIPASLLAGAAVWRFVFHPRALLDWCWVRALAVLVTYCVIWFALALRRKPVE